MDNRQLTFSHLLYLTAHHWRLAVNRRLKNLGLSQASWVAVASIARHQQPLSQSELAQELGVESPTIVPLIHRLVALGLVERITTASDKRKRLLVVTDKGKALYEQVKTVADDLREEILTAITPQEQEQTPAGAGKAVARSGEEIMPRRQDNPYAPHDWAPHEKPALLGSPSTPLHSPGETPCLRRGRSAGMSHRRAGQRSGHRQPTAAAGYLRRLVDRNRLAAGGIRDDQRLHQPAAGEIPPAVWPARFHRRLSGALCAGHLFPPLRQRSSAQR